MFPLIVCTFFIGILASLHMLLPDVSKIRTEAIDDSMAVNFCIYRTAVTQYLENSEHVQVVPNASLDLPPGYVYLQQWQARVIGDYCYVYGTTEDDQPWPSITIIRITLLLPKIIHTCSMIAWQMLFCNLS